MQKNNIDVDIDSSFYYDELTPKGMFYNDVPIQKLVLHGLGITLHTDTINFSAKRLLETLENDKGFGNYKTDLWENHTFQWDNEQENLKLKLELAKGNHLANIGEKDNATLEITFNDSYKIPLANIYKQIKIEKNNPNYILKINSYGVYYQVYLNNLRIDNLYSWISINPYILDKGPISLKIKVFPTEGNTFSKEDSFKATLVNETTEEIVSSIATIVKKGGTTYLYPISLLFDKKSEQFEINFTPKLNSYPKAWSDGVDLRKDKKLKKKIIALYKKIGEFVLTKDEQGINDLFYTMLLEENQVIQNTDYKFFTENWVQWLTNFKNTYKYSISENFKINFNTTGKLIKTIPLDKESMLILTGKNFNSKHNYYLYQAQNSSELKIIRQ